MANLPKSVIFLTHTRAFLDVSQKAWKFKLQGRVAKNILRLRELVTIISKQ